MFVFTSFCYNLYKDTFGFTARNRNCFRRMSQFFLAPLTCVEIRVVSLSIYLFCLICFLHGDTHKFAWRCMMFNIFLLLFIMGNSIISGIFFIFSNTIMKALAKSTTSNGRQVMNDINRVIINPVSCCCFWARLY